MNWGLEPWRPPLTSGKKGTEAAGQRLSQLLRNKTTFDEDRCWDWQRDAHGRTTADASLDATGVRQQGDKGARADGRMAYAGMLYNARSEHDSHRKIRMKSDI